MNEVSTENTDQTRPARLAAETKKTAPAGSLPALVGVIELGEELRLNHIGSDDPAASIVVESRLRFVNGALSVAKLSRRRPALTKP
jgi:hypothetical protein